MELLAEESLLLSIYPPQIPNGLLLKFTVGNVTILFRIYCL